jgi:hypothetical protein
LLDSNKENRKIALIILPPVWLVPQKVGGFRLPDFWLKLKTHAAGDGGRKPWGARFVKIADPIQVAGIRTVKGQVLGFQKSIWFEAASQDLIRGRIKR